MSMTTKMLNLTKILIAANQIRPFIYANYNNVSGILESIEGHEGKVAQTLSKYLNVEFELVDCNMKWGAKQEDGSWDGLVAAVMEERAHIGIGGITLTNARAEAIDYSYPHYINSVTFTSPLPERAGYSSSLLSPFDDKVWFSFLILVLFGFILSPAMKMDIKWSLISLILSQPIQRLHSTPLSVKLLISSFLLSVFVLRNYYSGQLFQSMTFAEELQIMETIHAFAKVLKSGKIKVLTMGAGTIYLPAIQNLDLASKSGSSMLKQVEDMDEYFQVVKAHPQEYSCIMERMIMQYNIMSLNIQQYLPPSYKDSNFFLDIQGVIMHKQSPLEKDINKALAYMKEAGLIKYWKDEFFRLKFFSYHLAEYGSGEEYKPLHLDQLLYSFKTAMIGIVISSAILICEMINSRILNMLTSRVKQNDYNDKIVYHSPAKLKNYRSRFY